MQMSIPSEANQREYRHALGCFATGITIVTTQVDQLVHGMTCNAFLSISLDPPLVGISIVKKAKMHTYLQERQQFGISVLSAEQESLSNHFAGYPTEDEIPFLYDQSLPLIADANLHLICDVVQQHPIGDHTLFVGKVSYFQRVDDPQPLLYHAGNYLSP